ncbi:DUF4192 family protein [Agromyces larvae]|uniref:DUF4192 domain-containing protein n=1 Tax=Agromyces larvae TaxID=2929802 RepID=A0ABY4BZE5_9MICO|nr:DUF4192 family protein [Agromyces larvae]UOE44615.1 DUF4192 domain-containing protein [Agromyces larvae]
MTEIIRAGSAHEFLALVPAIAGYRPERSLVCVAFRGNRTAGLLRLDLPTRIADHDSVAGQVIGTLCRMPGVDALVPVVYTSSGYASTRARREQRLLDRILRDAEDAGFEVRDALRVARDGWGSVLDSETPESGHPLALIEPAGRARGATAARIADGAVLPRSDARYRRAVGEAIDTFAELGRRDAFGRHGTGRRLEAALDALGESADPVVLVEQLARVRLEADGEPPEALLIGWLVHLAEVPRYRDAMMLQFAFGALAGEAAFEFGLDGLDAEPRGRYDDDVDEQAEGASGPDRSSPLGDPMPARLLLGLSTVRPDVDRVERALAVLRLALAHVEPARRAGLACMAAWLSWALGRGSAAAVFLDLADRGDPGCTMAGLLRTFFGTGALPEWAFHDELDPRDASRHDRSAAGAAVPDTTADGPTADGPTADGPGAPDVGARGLSAR